MTYSTVYLLTKLPYFLAQNSLPLPNTPHPWQSQQDRDSFTIHSPPRTSTHPDITTLIHDPISFQSMVSSLSKGKAPGPDGLTNEALQWASPEAKQALHLFLQCLWKARYTPQHWSASHTCLLFKKGTPTLLSNYRPIAMANTLSKVWTGWIARALSNYVEKHQLLSSTQEGFRPQKNSQR